MSAYVVPIIANRVYATSYTVTRGRGRDERIHLRIAFFVEDRDLVEHV